MEILTNTQVFRKNLKILMEMEQVNQRQLSREMDMSESNLSRILKGISSPTHDQIIFIGERFGADLNWLLRDIGSPRLPTPEQLAELEELDATLEEEMDQIEQLVDEHSEELKDLRLEVEKLKSMYSQIVKG